MSKFSTNAKRIKAAIRLAQSFDEHATADGFHRDQALREAQQQKITVFNALRAHILLRVAHGSAEVVSQWLKSGESRTPQIVTRE